MFFVCVAAGALLFSLMLIHASWKQRAYLETLDNQKLLVRALKLTDLCLFTDARYVRHISQSDLHTPFQDHPGAREHFPSGSLVAPPAHLSGKIP